MSPETHEYQEHIFVHSLDELEEVRLPSEFPYNETEATRLGLEKMEVRAYPPAQFLIEQVINKSIDITTDTGKTKFVQDWQFQCPDLPMPCVLKNTDDVIVSTCG